MDNTTVVSHEQGRGHEVGTTLCPTMQYLDLVYQKTSNSQSLTYPRPAECESRQTIQARPEHPNRVVSPSRGLPKISIRWHQPKKTYLQLGSTASCLCGVVTSTRSPAHSSGCTQSAIGGSGRIHLPTSSHIGQSGEEVAGLPMQENHSDCSGVAQHALVLASSGHVQQNPTEPAHSGQTVDSVLQSDPSQKSDKSKSPCLAPRASAIKQQAFSEALAARIEAPQRRSTRSGYEAKWAIFTKGCITNQVDFSAPLLMSVADFLVYMFLDRKLQPSTIDGYRPAIADKLGNSPFNISKDENPTCLLDRLHSNQLKRPP